MTSAGYRQVDLLQREALDPALADVEAIVHAAGGDSVGDDEGVVLDWAARGTYVALTAACAVGIEKVVLLSCLDLVRDYPEEYLVDPQWNALPRAEAGSLAPLMAELVGREIARTGQIEVRCLRLGEAGCGDHGRRRCGSCAPSPYRRARRAPLVAGARGVERALRLREVLWQR